MRKKMKSVELEVQPWLAWNLFIEVICRHPWELEDRQIPAHLAFMYEAEVQNGGHLQYFENKGLETALIAVKALETLDAMPHADILRQAASAYAAEEREHPEPVEQYVELALEGEFDIFDKQFHACEPALLDLLQEHFEKNRELYLDIE